MAHEPEKLFGGRIRTSTVVLVVLFAGILVIYVLVRPSPAQSGNHNGAPTTPTVEPTHRPSPKASTPTPTPTPSAVTPTPTSSRLVSPSPSPTPRHSPSSLLPLPTHS